MIALGFLLVVLVTTLAVLVFLVMSPVPAGPEVGGFIVANHLGDDVDVRRAVARYIGRTRNFARRGMVLGLLAALVLGVSWYQKVTVGFGVSPIGDLVTMGLGGWFIGLLLSARYWPRPAADGPRVAPLTPRDADRYRSPALGRAMAAVAGVSAVLGVAALLPSEGTERMAIAVLGVLVVATLGWAARTQGRITRRPQPFVTADLLVADDAMRVTSAQAIGLAGVGFGLVAVGWQAAFVVRGLADGAEVGWSAFLPVVPLLAGLAVAVRARRLIHPRVHAVPHPVAA